MPLRSLKPSTGSSLRQLHLYFGLGTKVHGPSLAAVVETANRQLHVRRFDPATFVHAKLIGAVYGNEGLLLCGSPNLSRAALTLTYADGAHGNCEIALIRRGSADQVRAPSLPRAWIWSTSEPRTSMT